MFFTGGIVGMKHEEDDGEKDHNGSRIWFCEILRLIQAYKFEEEVHDFDVKDYEKYHFSCFDYIHLGFLQNVKNDETPLSFLQWKKPLTEIFFFF